MGTKSDTGKFLQQYNGLSSEALATDFAFLILPLINQQQGNWQRDYLHAIPPIKVIYQASQDQEDGGDLPSTPDWSMGERTARDAFGPFARKLDEAHHGN